ncbi:alanine racemase [Vibrio splendidus]|uniref:alanine racemase n=1 Tax=Vibrio splendidus TaxID=29497 RepID=UPI0024690B44|nr:alanine racemase [Vibrio splendidus]MDH6027568.1 alanine racemase [Vibrio splendidus]
MSSPIIRINKAALLHNYDLIAKMSYPASVISVLKANAYGHGLFEVFSLLYEHGVRHFAVARIDEAKRLRQRFSGANIIVLQGCYSLEDIKWCSEYNVQPVIHDSQQIELLRQAKVKKNIQVWLKLNVGMNRLGFNSEDLMSCYSSLNLIECVDNINLISHLSDSELGAHGSAIKQLKIFKEIQHVLPYNLQTSIFNSAAALSPLLNGIHSTSFVRSGLSLYGVSPFGKGEEQRMLRTVMSLHAPIIAIREINIGEEVSYNGTWKCVERTFIATVSIGYGDGYPRNLGKSAHVLIGENYYKIIGLICMDMLMIDLGPEHSVTSGDYVTLWGEGLDINTVSLKSGYSPYELLSQLTARVLRVVV